MSYESLLFQGPIANGETRYVRVPIRDGTIGATIGWKDATSAATITLELTSAPAGQSIDQAGSAWEWGGSGLTITGPAGAAAGIALLNVENVRQKHARLKIVASAACVFEIWERGA